MHRTLVLIVLLLGSLRSAFAADSYLADLVFAPGSAALEAHQPMPLDDVAAIVQAVVWLDQIGFVLETSHDGLLEERRRVLIEALGLRPAEQRISVRAGPRGDPNRVALLVDMPAQPRLRCPWRAIVTTPSGSRLKVPVMDRQQLAIDPRLRLDFEVARPRLGHSVEFQTAGSDAFLPYDARNPVVDGQARLSVFATKPTDRSTGNFPQPTKGVRAIDCMLDVYSRRAAPGS